MLTKEDRDYLFDQDYDLHNEERLEQIAIARRLGAFRERRATDLYTKDTNAWFAEMSLLEIEEVVEIGLDPCYKGDVFSFLSDFAAGFSWDEDASGQMRSILDDPRFAPVAEYFQKELECNLRGCIGRMIEETKEFDEGEDWN